jgi:hypothetical protein
LYAVEVDSFAAIYYDDLKNIVLQNVDEQFDENIYNNHVLPLIQKAPQEVARNRDERIKFLENGDDQ